MNTKKSIYLLSFLVLGLLVGFMIQSLVEIFYIKLLVIDFEKYSFGLNWSELMLVQDFFAILVLAVCGLWGYKSGKYWWHQIYVLKKFKWKSWF